MNTTRNARPLEAADRDARFDWDQHNREIEAGLAAFERLNQIEAAIAQTKINAARDLQRLFEDMLK